MDCVIVIVVRFLKIEECVIPLFRVMEIQRICEVTATPFMKHLIMQETEGANLSEAPVLPVNRAIRGFDS